MTTPNPTPTHEQAGPRLNETGLNLFRQLVSGKNALRQLNVFWCNQAEHDAGCRCFWEQCEAWAKRDTERPGHVE